MGNNIALTVTILVLIVSNENVYLNSIIKIEPRCEFSIPHKIREMTLICFTIKTSIFHFRFCHIAFIELHLT